MRSSFFLSALIFAAVHSCSRSVRSDNTCASSVGGGVVLSPFQLSLLFSFLFAELELELFELEGGGTTLRRSALALTLILVLLFDAFMMLGMNTAAAIPNPAKTISTTARMARIQGQVLL